MHVYNARPALPDFRDRLFSPEAIGLPSTIDLQPACPPVVDQGQEGSCTANAGTYAREFDLLAKSDHAQLSRAALYAMERMLQGTPLSQDSGSDGRTCCKVLYHYGCPPELDDPYTARDFARKPSVKAMEDALAYKIGGYVRIRRDLNHMRTWLATLRPFIIGFTVYESYESPDAIRTGIAPMPQPGEQVLGGHEVMVMGYDDTTSLVKYEQSWGPSFGAGGFGFLPFAMFTRAGFVSDIFGFTEA